jgi:hypothetical protein
MVRHIAAAYRTHFSKRDFIVGTSISAALFIASIVANFYAGIYATERASNSVTDIILSNIPVFDVDSLFVYGTIGFVFFAVVLLIQHPKCFPFVFYSLALFFMCRGVFVTLTHVGPFPEMTTGDFSPFTNKLFFGDDFFFSGHTGTPYLFALMFWHKPLLRYAFLAWTAFFALVVLLGHLHYSIDVLGAIFVAYAIYHFVVRYFPKENNLFLSEQKYL